MSIERTVRKAVRVPIVRYRRRRFEGEGYGRHMLEAISYRRSIYRFAYAVRDDPELRNRYPLTAESLVVDFGAYDGEWAVEMVERYGCRVHAFEPVPAAFARLVAATEAHPSIQAWPYGLGGADGTVELTVAGPGSTGVPGVHRGVTVLGAIRDVHGAFTELGLDHIDLCKLNIEGAEYDVLDRMHETGWFAKVDHFQIQFHDFHPDAFRRRRRVRRHLRATHVQEWNYDWVFESWRRKD